MAEQWRLGVVERSVLEAMDLLGLRPDRPHQKSAKIIGRAAQEFGLSPRYGYEALCALSQPWQLHIPLVDFHGNSGGFDFSAAPPLMTEARLSAAGALVLAAERGTGPRVPVALINGDLDADGLVPPLSPRRVINTLGALLDDPDLSNNEVIERVGPPESPTGCDVACDHLALGRGRPTELTCTARIVHEDRDRQIVLTCLPPGIGDYNLVKTIAARVAAMNTDDPYWEPEHAGDWQRSDPPSDTATAIPLVEIRNESRGAGWGSLTRVVCELLPDADLAVCAAQITSTWGVTTRRWVQLPAPLPSLMRDLLEPDAKAQRDALMALDRLADLD